jgi:hypothetical protein
VKYKDFLENSINTLRQSINKRNSDNYTSSNKHRVICIGDSHLRGYGCNLTTLLGKNYEIYSVVKPGSSSSELMNSAKEEISKLSCEDLIVICSGTNDYELNEFSLVLRNISNFIQSNKLTNIAVMNIPFRYDLSNTAFVNSCMANLNKKIKKLIKAFPHANMIEIDNNRKSFTNHGLHRNKLGKRVATYLIASFIQSSFEQKAQVPVTLGWHNEGQDINTSCEENLVKAPIRSSNRNKKFPVTWSQDFLWVT